MGAKRDLIQRFLSHFATGDWEGACRTYVSEDFECLEPPELPHGGTFTGYDASIVLSNIYRGIWDIEVLNQEFWDDEAGDILISCYTIKWTSKKTGRSITQPVMEQNTIRNEKILRMRVFHFDAAGLLATLEP